MEKKYFDQSNRLNEGKKVTLKRRYTENYPAITAGKAARIRNKMLEAIADGKITQEEFDAMLSELSTNSKKWMSRNTKYFNVSEEGISLSKFGRRVLNQIKINENTEMKNFMFESFSDFISAKEDKGLIKESEQLITEGTRGQFGKIYKNGEIRSVYTHYDSYPEYMLPIIKKGYKKGANVDTVLSQGDNSGLDVSPEKMKFYGDPNSMNPMKGKKSDIDKYIKLAANDGGAEFIYLFDESDKTWYMVDVYGDRQLVPAFESFTNEGEEVNERQFVYTRSKGFNMAADRIEHLANQLDPNSTLCKNISSKADNVKSEFTQMKKHMDEIYTIWQDIEYMIDMQYESVAITEAFKSSKLRNLVNLDQSSGWGRDRNLAAAIYGLSKIKLDQIEDNDLIDLRPRDAYKQLRKSKDYLVFYIVDNEKENPYADSTSMSNMLKPGILAASRGSDFLGVQYNQRDSRHSKDPRGGKLAYGLGKSQDNALGGNKKYRGYSATGIYTVKRAAELADRAIAIDLTAMGNSSQDLIKQRAEAQEGAIAFKSDKDFKAANLKRYKDILATKASKMPLDKMVEDAINTLTKHIADAMKRGEKTKYNEIKIGEDKRGREIKLTDASNIMSHILNDYERYVRYVADDEKEKGTEYYSGYYEREMKEYAKRVSDRIKKVKDMDYAW